MIKKRKIDNLLLTCTFQRRPVSEPFRLPFRTDVIQANTRHPPNVEGVLGQSRRRWPYNDSTWGGCLVFAEMLHVLNKNYSKNNCNHYFLLQL